MHPGSWRGSTVQAGVITALLNICAEPPLVEANREAWRRPPGTADSRGEEDAASWAGCQSLSVSELIINIIHHTKGT